MRKDLFANEIVEAQRVMNQQIHDATRGAIETFYERTGLTPWNIDLVMIRSTVVVEDHHVHVLERVDSDVWPGYSK